MTQASRNTAIALAGPLVASGTDDDRGDRRREERDHHTPQGERVRAGLVRSRPVHGAHASGFHAIFTRAPGVLHAPFTAHVSETSSTESPILRVSPPGGPPTPSSRQSLGHRPVPGRDVRRTVRLTCSSRLLHAGALLPSAPLTPGHRRLSCEASGEGHLGRARLVPAARHRRTPPTCRRPRSRGLKRVLLGRPSLPRTSSTSDWEGRGARDLLLRRAVVGGLRHRGDAEDALHRRVRRRRLLARDAAVLAITCVLAILIFSYRQTIKAYPSAGGAYIVTKDNFGLLPAQVAGVALLTDYVLTVAVSVSAGVAAIIAAAPGLHVFRVPMAVAVHLPDRAREPSRRPRVGEDLRRSHVRVHPERRLTLVITAGEARDGIARTGWSGRHGQADLGLLAGVPLFIALHALASGSTAMTGVEAISNGVPAFKPPEWRNAQKTLTAMGLILGSMFIGISFLARACVPRPTSPADRRCSPTSASRCSGSRPSGT